MKPFERHRPLISLHVPKCGGQSLDVSLRSAGNLGYRFLQYYPEFGIPLAPNWEQPDTIIHGHFVRWKGQPVEEVVNYPQPQFTTVLRDPFETLLSGYFYGLREKQDWATDQSIDSYLDWFIKTGTAPLTGALLDTTDVQSVEQYLSDFVAVGVVEKLDGYVQKMQAVLGGDLQRPPRVNVSERSGPVPDRRGEFERAFPFDFELYRYCLAHGCD